MWTRTVSWRWIVVGLLAPLAVIWEAEQLHQFWGGVNHYGLTVVVAAVCVLALARRRGRISRARVVYWLGTRSYPIYLVHTLILYKVYQLTSGFLGRTGGIIAFLAVTAAVSEAAYRWVEVPAGNWISQRVRAYTAAAEGRASWRARLSMLLPFRRARVASVMSEELVEARPLEAAASETR
jgi:peptidoglycan/LPS O-acetylase OafA/YrhL